MVGHRYGVLVWFMARLNAPGGANYVGHVSCFSVTRRNLSVVIGAT